MVRCTVVVEGINEPAKHTFLVLPRKGEEVQLSTDIEADIYFVKHITHFVEGATDDEPEADVLIELTTERPVS